MLILRGKKVPPALTLNPEAWTAQRQYSVGEVVNVSCSPGNVFAGKKIFNIIKYLVCTNTGQGTEWIEQVNLSYDTNKHTHTSRKD